MYLELYLFIVNNQNMNFLNFLKLLLILPLVLVLLTACGPSQKQKNIIAEQACAIILETRKFESAKRIEILNDARQEVGDYEYPYPLSDDTLWFNLSISGIEACIDSIVEPPPPPPKTKAQLETEWAAQLAAEEKAQKEEEKKEKAKEEAKRKAEERLRYIAENTQITYLYCPSIQSKQIWEEQSDGQYGYTILGPKKIALIELGKIIGERAKLDALGIKNRFYHSERLSIEWSPRSQVYFDIQLYEKTDGRCYHTASNPFLSKEFAGYEETTDGKKFCIGEGSSLPSELVFDREDSLSFGNKILSWGSEKFILDRVTLEASESYSWLGRKVSDEGYQCEIVSKSFHDQKLQEARDKVKVEADAHRALLKGKESQEVQI